MFGKQNIKSINMGFTLQAGGDENLEIYFI